jgi:dihydroneopterin aldolase
MNSDNQSFITIKDLSIAANIGCSKEERSFPQSITLDVKIKIDLLKAALSKNLFDSICYVEIASLIHKEVTHHQWVLIEELSYHLIDTIFKIYPSSQKIDLSIRKKVLENASYCSVDVSRTRDQYLAD